MFFKEKNTPIKKHVFLQPYEAVMGMRANIDGEKNSSSLLNLTKAVNTIPCSSAQSERDFSLRNVICTDRRTSLLVDNISNLISVGLHTRMGLLCVDGTLWIMYKPGRCLTSVLLTRNHRRLWSQRRRKRLFGLSSEVGLLSKLFCLLNFIFKLANYSCHFV